MPCVPPPWHCYGSAPSCFTAVGVFCLSFCGPASFLVAFLWAVLSLPSFWFLFRSLGSSLCLLVLVSVCWCVFGFCAVGFSAPSCAPSAADGLPVVLFLLCCGLVLFPRWLLPPSPPGSSLVASWSSYFAGPSLRVSGRSLRRPGCLALMLGVLWCSASSLLFASWQQRLFGPVWGFHPLHHGAFVDVELCAPALRYSSSDDPGSPLDTAKLHTCLSLLRV